MSGGPSQERSKNEKNEQTRGVTDNHAAPPQTPRDAAGGPSGSERPRPVEHGGPAGLEPTRYGDWERAGRCIDF